MYDEVYEAWRRERENREVQALSKDFYVKLAGYMRKIREESRMLDEKTIKARLIRRELGNVRKMIKDLAQLRHKKILGKVITGASLPEGALTEEEDKIYGQISSSTEAIQALLKDVFSGQTPRVRGGEKPKIMVLRFLKEVPAMVGADMKIYGPFKPEDVATLPIKNAEILIRQGVAVEVEIKF